MLKYFYKTFLIAVLSGSLLTLQTSVAFAAGETTTDKNGVMTNKQSHSFEKITDADMMASITMLAGGFIAGRMIQAYTPVSTDVMIAGAAGVAFIAGEVLTNIKFKGTMEAMTVEVEKKSDGTVNEEQIQRLQDLKKSYEEAKGTTKTKKTLQLAAAVGFGLAGATALYMSMTEEGMLTACNQSVTYAQTALGKCIAAGKAAAAATPVASAIVADGLSCEACQPSVTAWQAGLAKYKISRTIPAVSMAKEKQAKLSQSTLNKPICLTGVTASSVGKGLQSACAKTILTLDKNEQDANPKDLIQFVSNDKFINKLINFPIVVKAKPANSAMAKIKNYLDEGFSILFPKAEAGWMPLLGLGGGIATAFFAVTAAAAVEIDMLMFVPSNRAIAFGLLAATSYLAAKASDNQIKKMDENIAKIEKILKELDRNAKGIKAQNLTNQQIATKTINPGNNEQIEFSKNATVKTECMQSNSTENCASVSDTLKNMPGFANLPDSFKDLATQTTSLGDKLSGASGISGSTLSNADAIASKQNAVSKLLKAQQAAYEKRTGVNVAKEQGKLLDRLNAGTKKALMKNGMTASGMMASIGGSPLSASSIKDEAKGTPSKELTPTQNVVDLSAKEEDKEKDSLNLNFKETAVDSVAAVDMSGGVSGTNTAEPEYQIESNEINGKNGPSLFEVLSNRYLKSGYPKLLEEEPVKN